MMVFTPCAFDPEARETVHTHSVEFVFLRHGGVEFSRFCPPGSQARRRHRIRPGRRSRRMGKRQTPAAPASSAATFAGRKEFAGGTAGTRNYRLRTHRE